MTEKTMSEGRLEEIRYYAENDPDSYVRQVLRDLLAELSRLRAVLTQQEAALLDADKALAYIADGSPWKQKLSADSIVVEYEEVAESARADLAGVRSDG